MQDHHIVGCCHFSSKKIIVQLKIPTMTSIKFILKNKPLQDGSHRVGLRLIKNRKKKVISLRISGPKRIL